MKKKDLLIENKLGLHARAAAQIVKAATGFNSKILLSKDGIEVDGTSIMGLMMMAAARGTTLLVSAEGDDEDKALEGMEKLFKEKFGEKE